jgi:hypothetical protein
MSYSDEILKKQKYFEKTLSSSAIYNTYLRNLDMADPFASHAWQQLSAFDLSELGLSLLYSIVPREFQPLALDFTAELPTTQEAMQGIWMVFQPVDFTKLYLWMIDMRTYVIENFQEQFQTELLMGLLGKAVYGVTPYGRGVYDPVIAREFLRSTFHKLRLIRTPDISWQKTMVQIVDLINMVGVTDEHIFNRLMCILSAQRFAFVLGLSVLGVSQLTETDDDLGVIPIKTAKGEVGYLHFRTLDHLQLGFILGITPLGYGLLLPKQTMYKLPEGRKNPPVIDAMLKKIRGIIQRLPLSTFAYTNYQRGDELTNYLNNQRTDQYHALMSQRNIIEDWVDKQIPPEEANPIRNRQYKNAVLQAISWRAKRHSWGYDSWKYLSEDEFKEWWMRHWKEQGLNETTLKTLYEGLEKWLKVLRQRKLDLGEKIRRTRWALALLS